MSISDDSEVTHTYDAPDLNEKVNNIDKKTRTISEKIDQLLLHSEDMEGLMNTNNRNEDARNEIVDQHFLHVYMTLAKQNQDIMYVRDKLFTEIIILRNDVKRTG